MKIVLLFMLLASFAVASSYKVDEKESSIKLEAKVTIKDITKKIFFKIEKLNILDKELTFELSSKIPIDIFELNGSMSGVISNEITLFANIKASKI